MQKLNLNHLFLVLFLLVCECCLKEKSNCSSFLLDSRLSPWSTANVNVLHCFVFQNTWTKFLVSSEIHLQRLLGMSLCELWTKYLVAYFMFQQQLFSKVKKISWGFFCLFLFVRLGHIRKFKYAKYYHYFFKSIISWNLDITEMCVVHVTKNIPSNSTMCVPVCYKLRYSIC